MISKCLPADLLHEISFKRLLETAWRSKLSVYSSSRPELKSAEQLCSVRQTEQLFLDQKDKVCKLLMDRRHQKKCTILTECSKKTVKAVRCFWSHITSKIKKSDDIKAVVSSITGTLKCGPEDIKAEVEHHLLSVFQGSYDPIPPDRGDSRPDHSYHEVGGDGSGRRDDQQQHDHFYATPQSPTLPQSDSSRTLQTDPQGWMDTG